MHTTASSNPTKVLPYAWVILAAAYLASVAGPFNQNKVPPILSVLVASFQVDLATAGSLVSMMALTGLVLALPAGMLLRRFGPKWSGLLALGSIGLGAALGALAPGFELLMLSRVLEGIGIGLIGVIAPALIAMWFPPERRGLPMGVWATWVPIGTILMYQLAPRMATGLGWRSVWWLGAVYSLVVFVFYALTARKPPAQGQEPGAQKNPGMLQALKNRDLWLLSLQFACFNVAFVGLPTYYPTFLKDVRGLSLSQAALVASIPSLCVLFMAPAWGWVSDRIGSRRLLFSLPYLAFAVLFTLYFKLEGGWLIALMIAQGLTTAATPTATFTAASELMRSPENTGYGLAAVQIGQNLGMVLGPLLFGQWVQSLGWVGAGYLIIPFLLLGLVSGWLVRVK